MRIIIMICVVSGMALGCSRRENPPKESGPDLNRTDPITFLESEVTTRKWTDSAGRPIVFLDKMAIQSKDGSELLINKYGYFDSKEVYCLDFYLKYEVPVGKQSALALLAHDVSVARVSQIEITNMGQQLIITINRQSPDHNLQALEKSQYGYTYFGGNRLFKGISEIHSRESVLEK